MNPVQFFEYGKSRIDLSPNTFIGGVASVIPNKASMAARFNIPESNIETFNINGENIETNIIGVFSIQNLSVSEMGSTLLKYIIDISGNSFLGSNAINNQNEIQTLHIPHVTAIPQSSGATITAPLDGILNFPEVGGIGDFSLRYLGDGCDDVYLPKSLTIGDLAIIGYNSSNNIYRKHRFYVHTSMINAVGLDVVKSNGGQVIGIQNYTKPNAVNDLTVQKTYSYLTLNFTAPFSTNTISHYEVFIDNGSILSVYKKQGEVAESGQTVAINLSDLGISVKIRTVDIYFNRSVFSNVVTMPANQATLMPQDKLASYYRLDGIAGGIKNSWSNVYHGINNGAIRGVAGKINNGFSFNGSATCTIPAPYLKGNVSHSIGMWVYVNAAPSQRSGILSMKPQTTGGAHWLLNTNMTMNIGRWGGGNVPTSALPVQTWVHVAFTYDKDSRVCKVYYNAVLNNSVTLATNQPFVLQQEIFLGVAVPSEGKFNGIIDETPIALKAWSQTEVSTIVNNGNGITL